MLCRVHREKVEGRGGREQRTLESLPAELCLRLRRGLGHTSKRVILFLPSERLVWELVESSDRVRGRTEKSPFLLVPVLRETHDRDVWSDERRVVRVGTDRGTDARQGLGVEFDLEYDLGHGWLMKWGV